MSQPQETDAQRTAAGTEDSAEAPAPDQSGTEPVRRDDAGDFSDVLLELDQVEPVVIRPQGPAETVSKTAAPILPLGPIAEAVPAETLPPIVLPQVGPATPQAPLADVAPMPVPPTLPQAQPAGGTQISANLPTL
ncbi:MAG: hypothetical protein AAFR17_17545, partial [Pseudomonadota bacterium]